MLEYEDIDITPVASGWLEAIQADRWSAAEAIAEAIDNSFGPEHGNADNVWITWNSADRTLSILDDGVGMEEPGLLLRLGEGRGRSPKDIGRYGSGGTMLCIWLADKVEVHTIRAGRYALAHADWKDIGRRGDWTTSRTKWANPATVPSAPYDLVRQHRGTFVILKVPQRRRIEPARIIEMLGDLYGPGLSSGKNIWFRHFTRNRNDGYRRISGSWMCPLDAVQRTAYVKTIGRDVRLDITGWIDPAVTRDESKVHIAFGHRVIKVTDDPFMGFAGLHVKALVELGAGSQDYLTQTKNDFADDEFYARMVEQIHQAIRPLLEAAATRAQQMLIEGITMNLELALEGLFDPNAEVPAGLLAPEPRYRWHKDEDSGTEVPQIVPQREPVKRLAEKPDGLEKITGGVVGGPLPLRVNLVDGSAMSGGLFSPSLKPDHILVELNQDHPHVQLAMDKGSPQAEQLLLYTALDAVTALILEDEHLIERMLPKQVAAAIADRKLPSRLSKVLAYLLAVNTKKSAA